MFEKIVWSAILEANRESIEAKILEAKKEAHDTMQGWRFDVEINQAGEPWTAGPHSTGSQSMSSWKGETFIVCTIKSWTAEVNESEDIKYDDVLYPEYLAQKDTDDGYETAYEFMVAKHPDVLQEWQDTARDYEISEFDAGEILDRAIEEQRMLEN